MMEITVLMISWNIRTDGDSWSKIGVMRDARSYHATSLIDFKDFKNYCKNLF